MKKAIFLLLTILTLCVGTTAMAVSKLVLPEKTEVIETQAFYGTKLTEVVLPDSVRRIESQAFAYSQLKLINLPDQLIDIATDAFDQDKYNTAIDAIFPYKAIIKGIHIWGKKKSASGSWVAHNGTLDTYFADPADKEIFIQGIRKICSDGQNRFLVPEVNSGEEDLKAVVQDIVG